VVDAVLAANFDMSGPLASPVPWVAPRPSPVLAPLMLAEAIRIVLSGMWRPPGKEPEALPVGDVDPQNNVVIPLCEMRVCASLMQVGSLRGTSLGGAIFHP